jgi:hypothetical protein
LFDNHPEVQDAFLPFQHLSRKDMEQSAILRSHALRVMGTVDKCITRLDTPDKLKELMSDLGKRHMNYNTKEDFIEVSRKEEKFADTKGESKVVNQRTDNALAKTAICKTLCKQLKIEQHGPH